MALSDRAVSLLLSAVGDPQVRDEIQAAVNAAATIEAAEIAAGAVANVAVAADAAIAYSKLATLASGNMLVGSAGGVATSVAMSGDVTIGNTGVAAIGSGVIVNADVNGSAAIAYSKLAALTSANILVGSAGNVATVTAVTGDVTIGNTGVTAIGAAKITSAMMNDNLLHYSDTTISTAEVLALRTTPKTLVAAPGAGFCIVPMAAYATLDYNSIAYDNGTDTLDIKYTGGSALMSFATTLVEASADINSYVEMAEAARALTADTAIVAHCSSADPTSGNSAIKIRVYYRIVPLLL